MVVPIIIVSVSWLLNAFMDAIDHGKAGDKLNTLWHILKWLSYAIPAGYIFAITGVPLIAITITIIVLWVAWEVLYAYLRSINFHKYDSF